jgi:hypothetical protein
MAVLRTILGAAMLPVTWTALMTVPMLAGDIIVERGVDFENEQKKISALSNGELKGDAFLSLLDI